MTEQSVGTLYVVGTPIGNLEEITYRAVRTLKEVDLILCEDCRHSLKLLNALDIKKPLKSHHKFNERATVDAILEDLHSGKNIALITDAGMPCISDPGNILVAACRDAALPFTVISGACAAIDALVLSGMDTKHFCFVGFLPPRARDRRELLARFRDVPATLVFYIAPHALNDDLKTLYTELGARKAVLAREITKLHEETIPFTLCEAPSLQARGEYVAVVEGCVQQADPNAALSVEEYLAALLASGVDKKEAVKRVARERGLSKNDVYQLTVSKKKE